MSEFTAMRRPSRASATDDVRLIARVARMYHEHGMRQTEIAGRLHISQTKVSRLLQKAVDLGIVRTVVALPEGVHTSLEEALEQHYGLAEVVVADVESGDGSPLAAVGAVAARYLESTLSGDEVLGISSWSETLLSAVRVMRPSRGLGARTVVQLVGGRGNPRVQMLATTMLEQFAGVLGADPVFMMTPAVLGTAQARDELLRDRSLTDVVEAWNSLTVALVGIGALDPSPMLAESGTVQEASERAQLVQAGAVGDVCLHYFDAAGRLAQSGLESRVLAVDEATLKAVPRRIGVAAGAEKFAAVRGSLLGGWVNILITDSTLAARLAEA